MRNSWDYPIFVIPHGPGYASLVDAEIESAPKHLLIVYTQQDAAEDLMREFGIPGSPRRLQDDREFGRLLQGLTAPVTEMATAEAIIRLSGAPASERRATAAPETLPAAQGTRSRTA